MLRRSDTVIVACGVLVVCLVVLAIVALARVHEPKYSYEQLGVMRCAHRGGINQLSVNDEFVVCRDGSLHILPNQ